MQVTVKRNIEVPLLIKGEMLRSLYHILNMMQKLLCKKIYSKRNNLAEILERNPVFWKEGSRKPVSEQKRIVRQQHAIFKVQPGQKSSPMHRSLLQPRAILHLI